MTTAPCGIRASCATPRWHAALAAGAPALVVAQSVEPFGASVAPTPIAFDLPAQLLVNAIRQYERQARQEVDARLFEGRNSTAVAGSLGAVDALEKLIAGTGLTWGPPQGAILTLVADGGAPTAADESAATAALPTVTADALDATTENSGSYTTGGTPSARPPAA